MASASSDRSSSSAALPVASAAREWSRWLALGAIAGPVLFTAAWLVLGIVSPGFSIWGTVIAPYSPISAGISGLGLGLTAPYMNAAFVLLGFLLLVGVVGIFRAMDDVSAEGRWAIAVLLALSALGAAMDGIFTLESLFPHLIGFLLATGTPIATFLVASLVLRRSRRWGRLAKWLLAASPLTLALLVLYFVTFSPTAEGAKTGIAGLTERILVTEVFVWLAALGWTAFRTEGAAESHARA
jgi:hypothetical protein